MKRVDLSGRAPERTYFDDAGKEVRFSQPTPKEASQAVTLSWRSITVFILPFVGVALLALSQMWLHDKRFAGREESPEHEARFMIMLLGISFGILWFSIRWLLEKLREDFQYHYAYNKAPTESEQRSVERARFWFFGTGLLAWGVTLPMPFVAGVMLSTSLLSLGLGISMLGFFIGAGLGSWSWWRLIVDVKALEKAWFFEPLPKFKYGKWGFGK